MEARRAVASSSGALMVGVRRARYAATSELCAAGGRATEQARCAVRKMFVGCDRVVPA